MEHSDETGELRQEFEIAVINDDDRIQDAVYWARMVSQCDKFLDEYEITDHEPKEYADLVNSSVCNPEDIREFFDYEIEMFVEDVSNAVANSSFQYVEKARDLEHLKVLLRDEWEPYSDELVKLVSGWRAECTETINKIKQKIRDTYPEYYND